VGNQAVVVISTHKEGPTRTGTSSGSNLVLPEWPEGSTGQLLKYQMRRLLVNVPVVLSGAERVSHQANIQ
jgi:hypothetical protein